MSQASGKSSDGQGHALNTLYLVFGILAAIAVVAGTIKIFFDDNTGDQPSAPPAGVGLLIAVKSMCVGDCSGTFDLGENDQAVHFVTRQTDRSGCPQFNFPSGYSANVWDGYSKRDVSEPQILAHVCEITVRRTF